MLKGRYRDVLTDAGGARLAELPWRSTSSSTARSRSSPRCSGEPGAEGSSIGRSEQAAPRGTPLVRLPRRGRRASSRRSNAGGAARGDHVRRRARRGREGAQSESRGATRVRVAGGAGDAARVRPLRRGRDGAGGSGVMINHVVHERIDLQPRQRLTRELRLLARAVGGGRTALARAAAALDRGRRRARHRRRRSPHRGRSGGQGHRDRRRARERRPAGRRRPASRAADRAPDEPGWPSAPVEVTPPPGLRRDGLEGAPARRPTSRTTPASRRRRSSHCASSCPRSELALDHRFLARMTVGALVGAKHDARGPRARHEGATGQGEASRCRRRAAPPRPRARSSRCSAAPVIAPSRTCSRGRPSRRSRARSRRRAARSTSARAPR